MRIEKSSSIWPLLGSLVVLTSFLFAGLSIPPAEAIEATCPSLTYLADIKLLSNVPVGSTISLSRITVQPGETLDDIGVTYAAYYVESGVLKYPLRAHPAIFSTGTCTDGRFSGGGVTEVDKEGRVAINEGEALIVEDRPIEPITNGGATPLILLRITLVPAPIDPQTGQPILDGVTASRIEAREREQHRQACKTARNEGESERPGTAEVEATPVVTDAEVTRVPRACRRSS